MIREYKVILTSKVDILTDPTFRRTLSQSIFELLESMGDDRPAVQILSPHEQTGPNPTAATQDLPRES